MDKKALSEVYDIIGFMDIKYQKKIPKSLKELIKNNREAVFDTGIRKLPESVDGLRRETLIILSVIYEKYILGTELDVSDEYKEFLNKNYKSQISENKELILEHEKKDNIEKTYEELTLTKKDDKLPKIILLIRKVLNLLKRRK